MLLTGLELSEVKHLAPASESLPGNVEFSGAPNDAVVSLRIIPTESFYPFSSEPETTVQINENEDGVKYEEVITLVSSPTQTTVFSLMGADGEALDVLEVQLP